MLPIGRLAAVVIGSASVTMPTIKVTDATFAKDVLESNIPVLVDFWAPWCGPCKAIAPALEELSEEFSTRLTIAKVNVDENPQTAGALRIKSIPTMVLFEGGRPTQAIQGAKPKAELQQLIGSWLPDTGSPTINVAELAAVLESGRGVRVIDVRPEIHFARSHIRGAECIEPPGLAEAITEQPSVMTVLVCRTGETSFEAASTLAQDGLPVRALEKGLLEWEGEGQPTFSAREEEALAAESAS